MSRNSIIDALVSGGLSVAGACAVGGNMMAESGMVSGIAQRGMTKLSDEEYTAAADAGTVDFVHDSVGYGLCQWTFHSRKAKLLSFAKSLGVSVGNESMQTAFCLKELREDYPELFAYLCGTELLYEAVGKVCTLYERPAVNNIQARAAFGEELFTMYNAEHGGTTPADCISAGSIGTVTDGRSPESQYAAAILEKLGYDVLWLGLEACLADFRQRMGINESVCGEKTWTKLREVRK